MKVKGIVEIAAFVFAIAIMVTVGVSAFAANDDNTVAVEDGRSAVWGILTEDQKAQLAADTKTRLDQALADGDNKLLRLKTMWYLL